MLTEPNGTAALVRVTPTALTGGSIRLMATLFAGEASISQQVFVLESDPSPILPYILGIGGALLYALYHLIQDRDSGQNLLHEIGWRVLTALLAGIIATLFADFDLLGMKLDTHVLRTYAILGFVFSYVGVDVLLGRRFKQTKP